MKAVFQLKIARNVYWDEKLIFSGLTESGLRTSFPVVMLLWLFRYSSSDTEKLLRKWNTCSNFDRCANRFPIIGKRFVLPPQLCVQKYSSPEAQLYGFVIVVWWYTVFSRCLTMTYYMLSCLVSGDCCWDGMLLCSQSKNTWERRPQALFLHVFTYSDCSNKRSDILTCYSTYFKLIIFSIAVNVGQFRIPVILNRSESALYT